MNAGDDTILYEDEVLQIGLKSDYDDMRGELRLFFGNKSSKIGFRNFQADYFVKETNQLSVMPSSIPPGSVF